MRRIALVTLLLLAACDGTPTEKAGPGKFERWRDPDYQVVCWTGTYRLSCLPESEVRPR